MQQDNKDTELKELRKQLTLSRQAQQEFVYGLSHDFSAPLRAVVNFSRMFRERYGAAIDDRGQRYLDFVQEGGEKAQAMLQALLEYSQLSTKTQAITAVDCNAVVQTCCQRLQEKSSVLDARITVGPLPVVSASLIHMERLFGAVLDNALTYRRSDVVPEIQIAAKQENGWWRISVEDNGIGIISSLADKMFLPFRRLHNDTEIPGLGMGLAFARRIVERHGGTINMTVRESGGTTVWFTLPAQNAHSSGEVAAYG